MAREFVRASSQYLTRSTAIINSPPITVAGWGYSSNVADQQHLFAIRDKSAASTLLFLAFGGSDTGDPVIFRVRDASNNILAPNTSTGYSVSTWHHLCGVWSAADAAAVYIDGGSKGTDSGTTVANLTLADRTSIGASDTTVIASPLDGYAAEIGVWNAALTDAEVASLAKGVSPLAVRPQSLVACWSLVGNLSPELDFVGGYNLTVTNGPTATAHPPVYKIPGLQMIDYPEPTGQTLAVLNPHEGAPV